jgi:signal transduction histidine kinase
VSEESATLPAGASAEGESRRVAATRAQASERHRRQRETLRPLGFAAIVAVAISALNGDPRPSLHGAGLGLTIALVVFAVTLTIAIRDSFPERSVPVQAAVLGVMGGAGVALVALQPKSATQLAGGAAVWMAVARLPLRLGVAVGGAITIGLDVALAWAGGSAAAVVATTLLSILLGLVAWFLKQARVSQEQTELLLAELEDAREQQLEAAAIAERGRIAGELHDVLAHALSGAAIQLQGARLLAEREHASTGVRAAIDRAGELVRDGLASARQAVGALRGETLPGVAQLESLVASYRDDMQLDIALRTEGEPREIPADAGLALYRGVQEALTNVARYAPGAATSVVLVYEPTRTSVTVENRAAAASAGDLAGVGGGRGLESMRERLARAGGAAEAGATDSGWRVRIEVPG